MKRKVVSAILLALLALSACTGCGSWTSTSSSSDIESSINSTISLTESSKPASPNTFQKVIEISKKASSDSKSTSNQEADVDTAIKWLKNNVDDIYNSNENMEKAMYYGFLLEDIHSGMNDNIYEIGMRAEIAVKYVYSKNDQIEDSSTQRHYSKLKELLNQVWLLKVVYLFFYK